MIPVPDTPDLFADVRRLIEETRSKVATAVNVGLTMLYWRIGKRIGQEILKGERAAYGKEIFATLSQQLVADYGRGFAEKNLRRMLQFVEVFPDERIVVTLSRQLSWSHFLTIIPLDQPLQRDFYAEMCRCSGLPDCPASQRAPASKTSSGYRAVRRRLENREGDA